MELTVANMNKTCFMTSVSKGISDMIEYLDVMIDNSDMYFNGGGGFFSGGIRKTTSTGIASARTDIDNILQAADKCIDVIEMHKKPK